MENTLDFATNGAMSPTTYANSFQGNSDVDYQSISSKPAPPTPPAVTNDTKDQAARLRALLSSHLSEGGSGNGQATGADRLEALIDMLYAMTAPAEAVAAPLPVSEEKPAAAPVAEAYTVTLPEPIKETLSPEPQNVEAALTPAPLNVEAFLSPASVEAPVAQVTETASASTAPITVESMEVEAPVAQLAETASAPASEEAQNSALPFTLAPLVEITESAPSVVAEAQAVSPLAVSEALEASQIEAPHAELPQTETPQPESLQEQAHLLETILPTAETTTEPAILGETFPVQESQATQEPTAFIEDFTEEDFTADAPTVFAVGEAITEDAQAPTRVPAMTAELLTMDERTALLNPLKEEIVKEERAVSAGHITFSFVTDKSTATLNIPMQANLSQITFEQRLDEIILKIHLSS